MDIRAEILKTHSKANSEAVAAWVGNDAQRMQQLMHIFMHDEYKVVQRAAHAIGKIGDKHPQHIERHIDELVKRMKDPGVHVAVKRNVIRVLQYVAIPEHLHADVMNTCFDLLADAKETVAVRVFSMSVLDKLSKNYPDIRQELTAILTDQLEQGCSAGFRSRASKILKRK